MPRSSLFTSALMAGVLGSLAASAPLGAQGSLGSLGFGYPVGGMSTRAAGTAGAFGDFDALSPLNPASIGGLERIVMGVQAEPEYRSLRLANGTNERTTIQRIPLLAVLFPFRSGLALGLSASSFLDRSYSLLTTGSAILDGESVATNDRLDIRGGIGEMRAAVGWQINPRFKVGVGGHLFTGENIAVRSRIFADTLLFGSVLDSSRVTYFGTGLSIGGEVRLLPGLAVVGSYRVGQSLDARIRDTVRTTAHVPDRLGAALRYDGIAGSTFSLGIEQVNWSKMAALGTGLTTAHDALNVRAGIEVQGPQFRGVPISFRGGYARNELPFSVTSDPVKETRYSAGIGLPVARDAASLDLSLQRANRVLGSANVKESAWLFGIGLQIRP
ncbi:hypothetical protein [Gemmatimonas aurantiaca]|uniref:hypothetical protein n=1 Tax=Gemmatimonas aurantiaca TaxID=173480 RepID=UPI00301D8177